MVQNGRLVTSYDGFCAHLGHVSVPQPDRHQQACVCGRKNCVESITSGRAIARQASEILGCSVSCKQVFEMHLSNPEVNDLIDRGAAALVELIANIKAVTGTEVVVLGGSIGLSHEFSARVRSLLNRLPEIYKVKLLAPLSGANADLVGAALYSQYLTQAGSKGDRVCR